MQQTCKYYLPGFYKFIATAIVIIAACEIDPRQTLNDFNNEVCIANNGSVPNKIFVLEKSSNTHDYILKASHTSEYYKTNHYNLAALKLKIVKLEPVDKRPLIIVKSRSIRITQFDEL